MHVRSTDGVDVAVHDLGGSPGAPELLAIHATGFHGRAYLPLAEQLVPGLHTLAPDLRAHGDTAAPPGWDIDWRGYGDDTTAVARSRRGGLIGFGHSMGGATLIMAAHADPTLFRTLVLFEPIVPPPQMTIGDPAHVSTPAVGARRRHEVFPSIEAAIANYGSKPPLDAFDPAALDAYVRYGFEPDPDGIRLKCAREVEATTFDRGREHDTWSMLADVTIPVTIVCGRLDDSHPAAMAPSIAEQLPNGRLTVLDDLDHFGPFTRPDRVAGIVTAVALAG